MNTAVHFLQLIYVIKAFKVLGHVIHQVYGKAILVGVHLTTLPKSFHNDK